nr:hypothetical protein [Tanacetum cinerariifolium]
MQTQESKIDMGEAVNDDLVVTESSGTESEVQDDNGRSGNDTDADNADIRPIYDEEPMTTVQFNAECNIFAIGQQHTEQPEIINEAQIQEKVFAIAALKNDLRKLKGNSVDTKFAKTSVLGKPVLQPLRNQSVVRQPKACKHGRPLMSKQHFASQVDVNHNEAKKKTQKRDRNSKPSVMTHARFQSATADSKPKHRSTNHSSRSLPMSKEVNSRAKIQSYKTRDRNKPVDQKSHTQIPGRQIFTGHKFSPNKTSAVYEKISPRSDLRWKPTGRIFKSVGLRWLPTRKLFDSCTSTVESKPTHGSNEDISKIHECKQTLDLSADQNSSDPAPECQTMASDQNSSEPAPECQTMALDQISSDPAPEFPTLAPTVISFENINQAETHAENDQDADDEFINIFSTPVQDQEETSTRHVDSSNMHHQREGRK